MQYDQISIVNLLPRGKKTGTKTNSESVAPRNGVAEPHSQRAHRIPRLERRSREQLRGIEASKSRAVDTSSTLSNPFSIVVFEYTHRNSRPANQSFPSRAVTNCWWSGVEDASCGTFWGVVNSFAEGGEGLERQVPMIFGRSWVGCEGCYFARWEQGRWQKSWRRLEGKE